MTRRYRTALVLIGLASVLGSAGRAQDAARGREIFQLCGECHGQQGHGNQKFLAPVIAGLPLRYVEVQLKKFKQGARGMDFHDYPGMRMRPMAMSLRTEHGNDLEDVSAYLVTLPGAKPPTTLTGGDATRGATSYAVCQACHGAQGEGVQGVNAPPLANQADWYLLSSLERYKSGARGSNPLDPNGALMRGMASILADEQAMKDVIAYITSLSGK